METDVKNETKPTYDGKTKRELLLERLRVKYPDNDFASDEDIYGTVSDDYDEYDRSMEERRKNEEELTGLLASDPRSADFLMSWKKGENPVVALIRMYGDEFREALEDPLILDKITEARNDYIARQTKNTELQEQAKTNLSEALDNLDKVKEENGYSDDDADRAFELFDKIVNDAIVNRINPETWEMMFRAINYDKDVASAAHEGEVRGRNTKIDEVKKKTTVPEAVPPMLGGDVGGKASSQKSMGALDRYGVGAGDIWQRGGIRRK